MLTDQRKHVRLTTQRSEEQNLGEQMHRALSLTFDPILRSLQGQLGEMHQRLSVSNTSVRNLKSSPTITRSIIPHVQCGWHGVGGDIMKQRMAINVNIKTILGHRLQIAGGLAQNDNHIIYFSHQKWDALGKVGEVVEQNLKDAARGKLLEKVK